MAHCLSNTIRIVLADDHQVVRDGLAAVLSEEDRFEIVGIASNGREAIEIVTEKQPDVLVIDISMPELNGLEATRRIITAAPHVRILCLSMYNQSRFIIDMLRAGCTGFVHKDSAFSTLAEAIREVHKGKRYIGDNILTQDVINYLEQTAGETGREPKPLLTSREREIIQLIAEGKSSKEIARDLHISLNTVTTHRQHIAEKLGISGTAELTRYALREGITT